MAPWYGVWFGYLFQVEREEDVEIFHSLKSAELALYDRRAIGATVRQSFEYVHKPTEHVLTPSVTESEILLFLTPDITENPAARVYFGPRGGVRTERL